jgi:uncharacterized membrane protein
MTLLHILMGALALLAGAVALYALKGGKLHRKSGMIFVCAMILMSSSGAILAALKPVRISVVAGLLALYLVCTAWVTVRRSIEKSRGLCVALMVLAFVVSGLAFKWAFDAANTTKQSLDGHPMPIYVAFGVIALIGALLDARLLMAGRIAGAHRLARHLWRMCFAMYLATSAFFLGQAKLLPAHLQNFVVLAIPVVVVLLLMIYWLVRVLMSKRYRVM